MRALTVRKPGLLTTVQDRGRAGFAHLGVPRSGAADLPALELANRLVGNDASAAGLETTMTGVVLRAEEPVTVAVTGAPATVRVDGRDATFGAPVRLAADAELSVGAARTGLRSYLAVAGGVAATPVLGSRATDTLSGLGPAPLRRGDTVPIGPASPAGSAKIARSDVAGAAGSGASGGVGAAGRGANAAGSHARAGARVGNVEREPEQTAGGEAVVLRVHPGPRVDWFVPAAIRTLLSAEYRVTPTSNRVGMRLTGPTLPRAVEAELPSEGVVLGAVQVPAGGEPLVFLADHPTTGGYPVVAVVDPADVPRAAQARPGTPVRFEPAEGVPGWI